MSSSINRFKHESIDDSESISKYLEALRDGFEKGALVFSSDEKKLMVQPRGLINMAVEAKHKDDEVKLTIKFRWSEASGQRKFQNAQLTIETMPDKE